MMSISKANVVAFAALMFTQLLEAGAIWPSLPSAWVTRSSVRFCVLGPRSRESSQETELVSVLKYNLA